MDAKDLKEGIHEIEEDVEESIKKRNPIWYVIAVFLVLIIIVMIIPLSGINRDFWPQYYPEIAEVVPEGFVLVNNTVGSSRGDYNSLVRPAEVKIVADKIASLSCKEYSRVCYAKAMYFFVRDKFSYVNDPLAFEYVKSAPESLVSLGGDCDDASVLLVNLFEAVGIKTRFVFVPGHVFVQANLPEAIEKYKVDGDWVNLDATCTNCEFGDIPIVNMGKEKTFLG